MGLTALSCAGAFCPTIFYLLAGGPRDCVLVLEMESQFCGKAFNICLSVFCYVMIHIEKKTTIMTASEI